MFHSFPYNNYFFDFFCVRKILTYLLFYKISNHFKKKTKCSKIKDLLKWMEKKEITVTHPATLRITVENWFVSQFCWILMILKVSQLSYILISIETWITLVSRELIKKQYKNANVYKSLFLQFMIQKLNYKICISGTHKHTLFCFS